MEETTDAIVSFESVCIRSRMLKDAGEGARRRPAEVVTVLTVQSLTPHTVVCKAAAICSADRPLVTAMVTELCKNNEICTCSYSGMLAVAPVALIRLAENCSTVIPGRLEVALAKIRSDVWVR